MGEGKGLCSKMEIRLEKSGRGGQDDTFFGNSEAWRLGRVSCVKWIFYCHVSVYLICICPFIRLPNNRALNQDIAEYF